MSTCYSCYRPVDQSPTVVCSKCNNALHEDCAINDGGALSCDSCYTNRIAEPPKTDYPIPETIRRSYIETYRTCPFKFLKQVIEGLEDPPNCYTQVGIDLHDLFEKGLNDRSYSMIQMTNDFQYIWDQYTDELFDDEKQREQMYQRSQSSISNYYQVIDKIPIPMVTEQKIFYEVGEGFPQVQFTMDAIIELDDDELEILDWKTGRVATGVKLSTDLQAPLYIYGVQKHYQRPVKRFTLYFVNENKKRVYERVEHNKYVCTVGKRDYFIDLDEMVKEVRRVFSGIMKGNYNIPQDTKGMFFACKMCHVKKAGLCEGAEMQSWYNK